MGNLYPEFRKNLSSRFWKNMIWSFLLNKAKSDFRPKSLNKVPFNATHCQNPTKMWLSIENLRKKCHWSYKIFLLCIREGEKPIFTTKHWFYNKHPPSRERFSLKIDVRAHITWNCLLELWLFHSSQMKLRLAGLFFQKSTR